LVFFFFFQAEDGIRDRTVTGVQTCALPISSEALGRHPATEHVSPLIALRAIAGADDRQLLHVVRIALRNQLLPEKNFAKLLETRSEERRVGKECRTWVEEER